MGFLWFGKKKNKEVKNTQAPTMSAEEFILRYFNEQRDTEALKLSAVYSAISVISNTMSKLPFSVINRFTKEKVDNENLYNLLNVQPNEKMNTPTMNKMLWTWVLYLGEGYVIPVRRYRSNIIEGLIPIRPDKVNKVVDENDNLFYDVNIGKGETLRLRYDEIIHLKAMTLDGINGISPLEYARRTVQTGLNQETFTEDFYKNYGRPLDYLKTQTDLSSKEKEYNVTQPDGTTKKVVKSMKDVIREAWQAAHTGDNRFSIAILDNGLEYGTVPQITPEQMEFVSSKTANVEDIARFFDMASCSFKLGIGKQTYSNNEQGQICYVTETIAPKLRQWEQELTLKLLTAEQREKGWVIKGNLNAELRGDTAARAAWYDKMRSMGVYNINEIRGLEDLPSIGDMGETRLIGANSIPLERLLAGETAGNVTPNDLTNILVATIPAMKEKKKEKKPNE